jgi:hypothetical protein
VRSPNLTTRLRPIESEQSACGSGLDLACPAEDAMQKSRILIVAVTVTAATLLSVSTTCWLREAALAAAKSSELSNRQRLDRGATLTASLDRLTDVVRIDGRLRLQAPDHTALLSPATNSEPETESGATRAQAYQYASRVFAEADGASAVIGLVRRGIALGVGSEVQGSGCDAGAWYGLVGGQGYVCSRDGFAISAQPREPSQRQIRADLGSPVPYRYGKASSKGGLRYYRIPSLEEEAQIAEALEGGLALPEVVESRLDGVRLLALDRLERQGSRSFYRTVRGRYVREQDVELKPIPAMRGELIFEDNPLPVAFVYGEEPAAVYQTVDGAFRQTGHADKHARFPVTRERRWGQRSLVIGVGGVAVARERVRIARRVQRPEGVNRNEKWIHVNLDEQTLVAYEGDTAVFATLVSSGKGEFATPAGLFRIRDKHVSVTMSGPDPDEGSYEVEEVPWTLYYHEGFALHGAYWHNEFGNERSHGCTNIAPTDARWLFYWTDGPVPPGWHALRGLEGTWVYLTRG